jgi:hypothetical protein
VPTKDQQSDLQLFSATSANGGCAHVYLPLFFYSKPASGYVLYLSIFSQINILNCKNEVLETKKKSMKISLKEANLETEIGVSWLFRVDIRP